MFNYLRSHNMLQKIFLIHIFSLLFLGSLLARDQVYIVGSSTVYPFATVVAENFGNKTGMKVPKVESTGSGGGMKLFCKGLGTKHPDITNSSRRIKFNELKSCKDNDIELIEVKIGYDGIVLANSKESKPLKLTSRQIFLALAKEVPAGNKEGGKLIANPNKKWSDISKSLPDIAIEVLGPPPTSGTRDAFQELAIEGGCKTFPVLKAIKNQDKKKYKSVCRAVREDGPFIEAGENDNLIVKKLIENPKALGIFGYSFLLENEDTLQGSVIDNAIPSFENIASNKYTISRPLYMYIKLAHVNVIPGIKEYVKEFTSLDSWGPDGYLEERGLISMPSAERNKFKKDTEELNSLTNL